MDVGRLLGTAWAKMVIKTPYSIIMYACSFSVEVKMIDK